MTHLVIVEGISDRGVVEGLAERLGVKVKVLLMRGNRPRKVSRMVNAALSTDAYDKVIILKDTHKLPEGKVRELSDRAVKEVDHERKYVVIVKKSIESWILAGIGVSKAEEVDEPDKYLNTLLSRAGRRYIKSEELARKLISEVDLSRAQRNSESLREFMELLKDP